MVKLFNCIILIFIGLASSISAGAQANFTASPVAGCPPLVVSFTNTGTGTSWKWELDNGNPPSPSHDVSGSYFLPGTYTATLTAYNGTDSTKHTQTITVYPLPITNFTADDTALCPGATVNFTSSTIAGVPGPVSYTWNFGDGSVGTGSPVQHGYSVPGYKNITLMAKNADGCDSTLSKNSFVHVYTPPTPVFSAATTYFCNPPAAAVFTSSVTGAAPFIYRWSFGDLSLPSPAANPAHTYSLSGSFTVKLSVTDVHSCADSVSAPGYIFFGDHTASFIFPDTACINSPVTFINTSTIHSSSNWSFGDGRTSSAEPGANTYHAAGLYPVKLIITDSSCIDTGMASIYIRPGPAASFTQNPVHPCAPPVAVAFTASVPAGAGVSWLFGDGGTGSGAAASHTFQGRGVDTIRMIVYDPSTGCRDTVIRIDTLYDHIFYFNGSHDTGCAPLTVNFGVVDVTYEPPPDTVDTKPYPFGISSYSWNFGDGANGTDPAPTHIYTAIGVFNAVLTAISGNGCIEADTVVIYAGSPPAVTFTATPTHVCFHDSVGFRAAVVSGPVNEYIWQFGDGNVEIDSGSRTRYTYTRPGIFSVTVTPYFNSCSGAAFVKAGYIQVDSPQAVINSRVLCSPPTEVSFRDVSLGDDSRTWVFGDGATSTAANPTHTYPAIATYPVLLATYNALSGCRDTSKALIDFRRPLPTFTASATNLCIHQNVTFTPNLTQSSYYWYINSGFVTGLAGFTWPFDSTGLYSVMLVFQNQNNCLDTLNRVNYIRVAKPIDSFTVAPDKGCKGFSPTFTDRSRDVAGTAFTNFLWTFGDGGTASAVTPAITHTYTAAGIYTAQEIVTDNIGCKDTFMLSPVTVSGTMAALSVSNSFPCPGNPVAFTNTSPSFTGSSWTFGDGGTSTGPAPSHTYNRTGVYNVSLVSTDTNTCTDRAGITITVTKPTASFYMDDSLSVCYPFAVRFINTSSGAASFSWAFGDGNTSTFDTSFNTYSAIGLDTPVLVATNIHGCRDTATGHVAIFGYAGSFSYSNDSGCLPLTVQFVAGFSNVDSMSWDFTDGTIVTVPYSDTFFHAYSSPGFYVPKLILLGRTSGCAGSSIGIDTIKVYGGPGHLPAITGPTSVCLGDSILLSDARNGGTWSSDTALIGVSDTITITGIEVGNLPVTYTVTNDCGNMDTFTVIRVNPLPDADTIRGLSGVCIGEAITLSDTASGGAWTSSDAGVATISGVVVTGKSAGIDTIRFMVTNVCGTDTATKLVSVNPLPGAGVITGRSPVCQGAEIDLSDAVTGGKWSASGGMATIDSSTGKADALAAGTAVVTYSVGPDTNGCVNLTTFMLSVASPLAISATVAPVSCYGSADGSITLAVSGGIGIYEYIWSNGGSSRSINVASGMYSVRVTDSATLCAGTDSFLVAQPDSLEVKVTDVKNAACNAGNGSISISLGGGTSPYSLLWSNNKTDSVIVDLPSGDYTLIVRDLNNCNKSVTVTVKDTCDGVKVHDVITPNGDGINDAWVVEGITGYPKNTVYIFDKWGTLLYQKDNYANDWYGQADDGAPLPDGTFFYVVKLNAPNASGGANVFTGALLIKR